MLNLLPPEIKQKNQATNRIYSLTLTYVILLVVLGLGAAGLTTLNFINQSTTSGFQTRLDELKKEQNRHKALTVKAAFIEDRIKAAKQFRETREWEDILDNIAQATPVDLRLTGIRMSLEDQKLKISLEGSAKDRRSIVLYRDKLTKLEDFSEVAIEALTENGEAGSKTYQFSLGAIHTAKEGVK